MTIEFSLIFSRFRYNTNPWTLSPAPLSLPDAGHFLSENSEFAVSGLKAHFNLSLVIQSWQVTAITGVMAISGWTNQPSQ